MTENFKRLLAHKLGNLVMLARNPIEMLDEPGLPEDHRVQLRAMLLDSLDNMQRMCRNVTDLGRLEEIEQEQRTPYQPGLSFQHAVQQIADQPASSAHQLNYRELSPLPGELVGYSDLIESAVEHIIENAVKFSPQGGPIAIDAYVEDERLMVCVTDHGLGIPEDQLPRLFDPFFRYRDRQSVQIPGLGLGLAVAWAVARAHGGIITVQSVPGQGSTFSLLLPLAANRE